VSIVTITLLVLLFGEISPKHFAIQHAERLIPIIVKVLTIAIPLLYPLSWCLQKLLHPFRSQLQPERRSITDEEIVSVVNLSEERDTIDREEGAMVRGVLRLSELNASDVMTPRVDLMGLDINDSPEVHFAQIHASPFVWMPLWDDSADNFIDFVDVSRYLLDPNHNLEAARCHYTLAVPENIGLDDLLITLYRQNLPMVLVTDEYGGTAGIVSRGDILELLSLEADDNIRPLEEPDIRKRGPNCWIVAGDASLEQINYLLGTHLEADDADRMSGWVTFHSGNIPKVGETICADGYRVTVRKMRKRKILVVMLEDLEPSTQDCDKPPEPKVPQADLQKSESTSEDDLL
ncbi:MAG: HlyC/CorC family transporter, partial [Kiritimatiellae bacterium]|nr:HlyC/CorC family transporter [Kiritimatiellia bacterium]